MKFIDEARCTVISGKGGDGVVRFRREAHVPLGGPSGGDGGDGGDVVFIGDEGRMSLLDVRMQQRYRAKAGEAGGGSRRTGASGESCEVRVPVGTLVYDDITGELVGDVTSHGQRLVAAKGGKGGLGNCHFTSSTNRSPRQFTPGEPAVERSLRLELKLLADVGLIGFPNAGKSTLISRMSAARPKIADYPFTTLVPQLGLVRVDEDHSFVMADIPGLIEGASEGAGLGHQFLRHVERTRLFLHLVSLVEFDGLSPWKRFRTLQDELRAYDAALMGKRQIVVLTKLDALADRDTLVEIQAPFVDAGLVVRAISSHTGEGLQELRFEVWRTLQQLADPPAP